MKLKDILKESEGGNVESWARSIDNAIQRVSASEDEIIAATESEEAGDAYYQAAEAIVEPMDIDEDYYEWMDNDVENWANWIANTYGEPWGTVAKRVAEEGY